MKISKCIIAFVVAIAMVFALSPVSFASTDNTLTSDTTITLIDGSVLSVPEKAITGVLGGGVGSSTYIVHQVQEGFYYRFMIDTFTRSDGVAELETLSWRRFVSESFNSLEDTLLTTTWTYTDFTDVCYDPSTVLSIGRGSVDPVYATFDYCDSFGNVIIADCNGNDFGGGGGGGFEEPQFMTITLDDGTKLSVPIALSGTDFFVIAPDVPTEYTPYVIYQFDDVTGVDFGVSCNYTLWSTRFDEDGYYSYNGIACPETPVVKYYANKVIYQDVYGGIYCILFSSSSGTDIHCTQYYSVNDAKYPSLYLFMSYKYQLVDNEWVFVESHNNTGNKYYNYYFDILPASIWTNFELSPSDDCGWYIPVTERVAPVEWYSTDVSNAILTKQGTVVYSTFEIGDHTVNEDDSTGDDSGDDTDTDTSEDELGWLQKIWSAIKNGFASVIARLNSIIRHLENMGGGGDLSISIENNTIIDEEDKEPFNPDVYKGVIKTLRNSVKLFSGFFGFIYDGVNNFIVYLTDTSSEFYGLFHLSELG